MYNRYSQHNQVESSKISFIAEEEESWQKNVEHIGSQNAPSKK